MTSASGTGNIAHHLLSKHGIIEPTVLSQAAQPALSPVPTQQCTLFIVGLTVSPAQQEVGRRLLLDFMIASRQAFNMLGGASWIALAGHMNLASVSPKSIKAPLMRMTIL